MVTDFQVNQHEPTFSFAAHFAFQCAASGRIDEATQDSLGIKSKAYADGGKEPIH